RDQHVSSVGIRGMHLAVDDGLATGLSDNRGGCRDRGSRGPEVNDADPGGQDVCAEHGSRRKRSRVVDRVGDYSPMQIAVLLQELGAMWHVNDGNPGAEAL